MIANIGILVQLLNSKHHAAKEIYNAAMDPGIYFRLDTDKTAFIMTNNCHACMHYDQGAHWDFAKYTCLRLLLGVLLCGAAQGESFCNYDIRVIQPAYVATCVASWFRPDYLRLCQCALQEALKFYVWSRFFSSPVETLLIQNVAISAVDPTDWSCMDRVSSNPTGSYVAIRMRYRY